MEQYSTSNIQQGNEPVLRPKLIFWIVVLSILPLSLFLSIWATGFFGGFLFMFLYGFLKIKLSFFLVILALVLLFILINSLFIWIIYGRAKKSEYHFFEDRIEYYEGFLSIEKKVVYYSRITNIGLKKGLFEKRYGLGSIYIDTASSSPKGHELNIASIENPDQWYKWLFPKINQKNLQ